MCVDMYLYYPQFSRLGTSVHFMLNTSSLYFGNGYVICMITHYVSFPQGRLLNQCCSRIPSLVISITSTTQVGLLRPWLVHNS